jgi:hypothetical protein
MKTVILFTHTFTPTKSNSFSDADRGAICWFVWYVNNETDKTYKCFVNFSFCWQADKKIL